ncbi:Uncharacterised protein [Bordetella pertussis]|nr:Uncharacterised protein [Bordetella pertussis]
MPSMSTRMNSSWSFSARSARLRWRIWRRR